MGVALTKTRIDAALRQAAGGARPELADDREPGLRLRAGERSAKWSLLARTPNGQRIRVPVGTYPAMGLEQARTAARAHRKAIETGSNPNVTRKVVHASLGELLAQYDTGRLAKLRTGTATRRALDAALGKLVTREAVSITRGDIAGAVDKLAKTAPISANRALAYIRAFLGWCVERGHLDANPAAAIGAPSVEVSRDRTPDLGELVDIWRAAAGLGWPFGTATHLLMLLGSRREEVGAMQAAELDLDANQPVWTIPADRSKNGRAIRVPLAPAAVGILREALAAEGRPAEASLVFTTTGETPVSGWSRAKERMDRAIAVARQARGDRPMADWRLHDLRRSLATLACDVLHADPVTVDRCLNHVGASTTSSISRVYARAELFDQRRDLLAAWATLLGNALAAGQGAAA